MRCGFIKCIEKLKVLCFKHLNIFINFIVTNIMQNVFVDLSRNVLTRCKELGKDIENEGVCMASVYSFVCVAIYLIIVQAMIN